MIDYVYVCVCVLGMCLNVMDRPCYTINVGISVIFIYYINSGNLSFCLSWTLSKMDERMDTKRGEPTVLIPGKDLRHVWRISDTTGVPHGVFLAPSRTERHSQLS